MSYKEKFDELIGEPFELVGYPDYVITINPTRVIALIDIKKFKELVYKPFITVGLPAEGDLYVDNVCFNAEFILAAIDVLQPKEYAIDKEYDEEQKRDSKRLILKNGKYGIMIAPSYPKDDEENKKELNSYIKKPPKSVYVL